MAKRKDEDGGVAVATEPGEQKPLFPELEDSPEHKAVLKAAKAFAKAKAERDALLSTSKEKVDGLQANLIACMHKANLEKFKHDGVKAELIKTREKVTVQIGDDEEEETEGDDE